MKRIPSLLLPALALLCGISHASDAYFVRFNAQGRQTTAGGNIIWLDDILFYNTGTAPATVRFLGVSNGASQGDVPTLTLPPGETVSLNAMQAVSQKWLPVPVPPLWVLHLDALQAFEWVMDGMSG